MISNNGASNHHHHHPETIMVLFKEKLIDNITITLAEDLEPSLHHPETNLV